VHYENLRWIADETVYVEGLPSYAHGDSGLVLVKLPPDVAEQDSVPMPVGAAERDSPVAHRSACWALTSILADARSIMASGSYADCFCSLAERDPDRQVTVSTVAVDRQKGVDLMVFTDYIESAAGFPPDWQMTDSSPWYMGLVVPETWDTVLAEAARKGFTDPVKLAMRRAAIPWIEAEAADRESGET
jgi:hypothetical protein